MSPDERVMANGRLVEEYSTLQRQIVALKSEGQRYATILGAYHDDLIGMTHSGNKIVDAKGNTVTVSYPSMPHLNASGEWPMLEQVRALVDQVVTTKQRLAELTKELQALGLPIGVQR